MRGGAEAPLFVREGMGVSCMILAQTRSNYKSLTVLKPNPDKPEANRINRTLMTPIRVLRKSKHKKNRKSLSSVLFVFCLKKIPAKKKQGIPN